MTNKEKLIKTLTTKVSHRTPDFDLGILMKRWFPKNKVRIDVPDCGISGYKENRLVNCIEKRGDQDFKIHWWSGPEDSYTSYASIKRFKITEIEKLIKFF